MSGYIVDDGENIIITDGETETLAYWKYYSPLQKERQKKVLKQLLNTWYDVEKQIQFFIDFNIDIEPFVYRLSKMFFLSYRISKEHENHLKQQSKYKNRRLNKLRNAINKI
mgnify:CR=1 FL=1